MAVELRDARKGDELAVAEVHVRSWQEAYRGLMPGEFLDALELIRSGSIACGKANLPFSLSTQW